MNAAEPLLIVTATDGERARLDRDVADGRLPAEAVELATIGVGKSVAAAATARLLARAEARGRPFGAVLLAGIAGTYAGAFVPVGACACASVEIDLDRIVARAGGGAEPFPLPRLPDDPAPEPDGDTPELASLGPGACASVDRSWARRAAAACGIAPVRFATSDGVSGDLDVAAERAERSGAAIESMEGFAVAVACAAAGVPFVELRGVSNVAGERDAAAWRSDDALRAVADAVRRLVAATAR